MTLTGCLSYESKQNLKFKEPGLVALLDLFQGETTRDDVLIFGCTNHPSDYPNRLLCNCAKSSYAHLQESKRRGLKCRFTSENQTVKASKTKTQTYTKPIISSAELDAERQKRIELERKLAVMEAKQKQEQQRIDNDTRVPLLEIISNKTQGKRGTVHGFARDNVEVAEVTVNGKPIYLSSNGKFKFNTYVPPTGKKLKIEVTEG